jgi:hypothetical protein
MSSMRASGGELSLDENKPWFWQADIKSAYSFSACAILLFLPVIEARFRVINAVAIIRICFSGVWLLVDIDWRSLHTILSTVENVF